MDKLRMRVSLNVAFGNNATKLYAVYLDDKTIVCE